MMHPLSILLSLYPVFSFASGYGDDLYPCDIATEWPPTVWAPTGTYTSSATTASGTTASQEEGSIVLIGGKGPHEGNVYVRDEEGRFGPILSCEEGRQSGPNWGWCEYGAEYVWSCQEADVVCRQLGYSGAETFSVNHKYGIGEGGYEEFVWKNVVCSGSEDQLKHCDHELIEGSWGTLGDGRLAGVSCLQGPDTTTTLAPDTTTTLAPDTTTTLAPDTTTTLTPDTTTTLAPETTTTTTSTCPQGWMDVGHLGCFYFRTNMTVNSWNEANLLCEDMGGFLIEPKTEEIQKFFSSLLTMSPELWGATNFWIGLSDTGHDGSWLWVHEAEFAEEQFWASSFPSTEPGNDADCAMMSWAEGYLWQDLPCEGLSAMGVICQM